MDQSIRSLSADETITIRLFVFGPDFKNMRAVVQQLLPHCDYMHVLLTDPQADQPTDRWTTDPRVTMGYADFRDEGIPPVQHGYCLQTSDAFSYPSEYVGTMVSAVEQYKRTAIVGLDGNLVVEPASGWRCAPPDGLSRDMPVHLLGADTLAYHVHALQVPGYRSVQLAIWAQCYSIPLVALRRTKNWVTMRTPGSPVHLIDPEMHRREWQLHSPA